MIFLFQWKGRWAMKLSWFKAISVILTVGSASACLAAAGAGLGAGIYLSDRGAESLVDAPIEKAFEASRVVFSDMGMTDVETRGEQSGSSEERQISGKRGDKNVKVTLRTEGESTRVEVVASEDMVVWDKDRAREVLEKIVNESK
jgi:hypothetical protein